MATNRALQYHAQAGATAALAGQAQQALLTAAVGSPLASRYQPA